MIKDYIKEFDTDSEYQSYITGDPVLPNVSYIVETNGVAFNPYVPIRNDIITYGASEKLVETEYINSDGLYTNAFGGTSGKLTMTTHTFENGIGTIEFDGDVTSIGKNAFSSCGRLTSITIPDSVTSIGESAFEFCIGLTSITIPSGVTSIGDGAFNGCYFASSNFVNNSDLNEINNNYWGATIVEDINGLLIKDNEVFTYRGISDTVAIPDSVTSIGDDAFYGCTSLTSITIGSGVTSIGQYAFSNCDSLTSVTIPDSVTTIDRQCFWACTNLTSVTIGSGVTHIGDGLVSNCPQVESITIYAVNPPALEVNLGIKGNDGEAGSGSGLAAEATVYVPSSSVNAYKEAETWSNYSNYIQAIV